MDRSNGYEHIAASFIKRRGQDVKGVGASMVRRWSKDLPTGSTILDLGCGTGIPISKVLIDQGMNVHGVDASQTMVRSFKQNFPNTPVVCEAVEDSLFFNRKFDAIIAWGLLFLLQEETQAAIIRKAGIALRTGGRLLFTAPAQMLEWDDVMTEQRSVSLGRDQYMVLLAESRLSLINEFEDEGGNHYFDAIKLDS